MTTNKSLFDADIDLSGHHIKDFYRDAGVFVSGGSGFLGKVILEKLLRTCTEVRVVYVMLRPKRGVSCPERLQAIIDTDLFRVLRTQQPQQLSKLHFLVGDMAEPDLGMSAADRQLFRDEINVVVHAAATVRFNEPMRVALNLNVLGTKRLLDLCGECKQLKSVVHVSTAYVNGDRLDVDECVYPPNLSIDLDCLVEQLGTLPDQLAWKIAEHVEGGFANTYVVTKRLAEQVIDKQYRHLPVCIVRPSIIMPTLHEPFAGWLDAIVGPIFAVICAMTGILTYFVVRRDKIMDIIPLDYVSNMILVAAWFDRASGRAEQLRVFNCTSGSLNPALTGKITDMAVENCRQSPSVHTIMYPRLVYSRYNLPIFWLALVFHVLPAALQDGLCRLSDKKSSSMRNMRKAQEVIILNLFFVNNEWKYGVNNVQKLVETCARTADGLADFNCDVRNINYQKLAYDSTMATRKYILHDDDRTLPLARNRLRWIYAGKLIFHGFQLVVLYLYLRWFYHRVAIVS